jgi:hypothetical protein
MGVMPAQAPILPPWVSGGDIQETVFYFSIPNNFFCSEYTGQADAREGSGAAQDQSVG